MIQLGAANIIVYHEGTVDLRPQTWGTHFTTFTKPSKGTPALATSKKTEQVWTWAGK